MSALGDSMKGPLFFRKNMAPKKIQQYSQQSMLDAVEAVKREMSYNADSKKMVCPESL